jgi:hypothetical protein
VAVPTEQFGELTDRSGIAYVEVGGGKEYTDLMTKTLSLRHRWVSPGVC